MTNPDRPDEQPAAVLQRFANGYQISQALHVAAKLGIADLLCNGPRGAEDLAAATGTHSGALYRVLRALASAGVFQELADRTFALTPVGEGLRSDAPDSLAPWATLIGEPYYWQAWGHLLHSVQTGENAFHTLQGMDVWTYRDSRPEANAVFNRAMTGNTLRVTEAVLAAYDFSQYARVVDVGGGHGAFLSALLRRHPSLSGILFDQPQVVAGSHEVLAEVAARCRIVGGSFFESVPEDGDAYVLKSVLHDWEDEDATAILRVCRRALRSKAKLLILERVVGAPNEGAAAAFSDLNMLVMPGGRERTLEEYGALFAAAGLQVIGVTPTRSGVSVVEGIPL